GLLRRVQLAVVGRQVFDRPQRQAVDRMGQADAAVDGAVRQAAFSGFSQHHGAGAAVAFAAALLGAGAGEVLAQQLQERALGWYIGHADEFAAADESDRLGFHANQYGSVPARL